ncbi:MAG: aspartate dehydrogenase [Pseudomonadota bacterium]
MQYRVAIAGLGAIGMNVARAIDGGRVSGLTLAAVSARDVDRAQNRVRDFKSPPQVHALGELANHADIIIECVPARSFRTVAEPTVEQGRWLVPLSVGALLEHMDLVDRARETGARIAVPTGALIGLDTVRAMAVGEIQEVRLETRKPPAGLAGAPYLEANAIDVSGLTEPLRVFAGTAREAARAFPANVNVAAALGLAGLGPDRTMVEVWADPEIARNQHTVTVTSDSGEATMIMRNIPSDENPRTGRIVANSVIASLQRFTAPIVSGS